MNFPLVSVNVLSFNDKKTIEKSVESALNQIYPNIEIIIISNASTDGTVNFLENQVGNWRISRKFFLNKNYPQTNWEAKIKFIKNSTNRGFAAGHNQAIYHSKADFILCLNSDAILAPNYIQKALEPFGDEKVGAVQGKVFRYNFEKNAPSQVEDEPSTRIIDTTGLVMLKNRRIINRGQGEIDRGQYEKSREIFGADGAVPLYRRKALEDIKLPKLYQIPNTKYQIPEFEYFDENFFLYKEDVDLAWRLRLYGWKCVYTSEAIAFHGRGAGDSAAKDYYHIIKERQKISPLAKYYSFKNQRLMQIKNEIPLLFIRHLPWFLVKEIGAWLYIIFFERFTLKALVSLVREMPIAFKKRKIIMANKKVSAKEMARWFW